MDRQTGQCIEIPKSSRLQGLYIIGNLSLFLDVCHTDIRRFGTSCSLLWEAGTLLLLSMDVFRFTLDNERVRTHPATYYKHFL